MKLKNLVSLESVEDDITAAVSNWYLKKKRKRNPKDKLLNAYNGKCYKYSLLSPCCDLNNKNSERTKGGKETQKEISQKSNHAGRKLN